MKRLLSTALAVALLLGLGALAVLARGGGDILTPADNAVAVAAQPQTAAAPLTTPKYNVIAFPLNAASTIPDAAALVVYLNRAAPGQPKSVDQVLHWNAAAQDFTDYYFPNLGLGTSFPIQVGEAYWILLDQTAPNILSIVGDVPPAAPAVGAIKYNMHGATPICLYNNIIIPLDRTGKNINMASDLVTAMGGPAVVDQVLQWDATAQDFTNFLFPNLPGVGTDFPVQVGYPYMVCLRSDKVWP